MSSIALRLYDWAWRLAKPFVRRRLETRSIKNPEYRLHHDERWALSFRRREDPKQRLIWVHAVSLGETRAAIPLIRQLLATYQDAQLLLTHMTPTGREAGQSIVSEFGEARVSQCYLPYDLKASQERFLVHWNPAIGVIMETEVWPQLCAVAQARQIPLLLMNARLSEKSLRLGLRWKVLMQPALRSFRKILPQTMSDAQRINTLLGETLTANHEVPRLEVMGNLKYELQPDVDLLARGQRWREALKQSNQHRSVILFAVSREGEEKIFLDLWRKVDHEKLFLVIVPRHPERFDDVCMLAQERGLRVLRRSQMGGEADQVENLSQLCDANFMLGDSLREMPLYYSMSDVAILGGSFLPFGGQNLIESLACGCPMISGPHTYNFAQATQDALSANALIKVGDCQEAIDTAINLASDASERLKMIKAGLLLVSQHQGATARALVSIMQILPVDPPRPVNPSPV